MYTLKNIDLAFLEVESESDYGNTSYHTAIEVKTLTLESETGTITVTPEDLRECHNKIGDHLCRNHYCNIIRFRGMVIKMGSIEKQIIENVCFLSEKIEIITK